MTQTNLLELAKQGDPQAIATLMNRSLQPRGMTAEVELQGSCLRVALEAEQVPNRQALTAFVQNGIGNLGIKSIQSIKVVGRQIGASVPAWVHEIILDVPADAAAIAPPPPATVPAAAAAVLPPALPLRPTPPPMPPFRPAVPPLAEAELDLPELELPELELPQVDVPIEPPEITSESAVGAVESVSESQFERLELEDLGLDDLEFEEFDESAIAPLSDADFGFPDDSELEEAIANDFGVSETTGRDGLTDSNDFTSSLDDLGLGALDDEADIAEFDAEEFDAEFDAEFEPEAIANPPNQFQQFEQFEQFEQFDQDITAINSLEAFDFGDEFSAANLDPDSTQSDSEPSNPDDLLASLDLEDGLDFENGPDLENGLDSENGLDFEDGLDLDAIDLTSEFDLTSELDALPLVSDTSPELDASTGFESDLSFADDRLTDSEPLTDPLADLALEDAFDDDDFALDSEQDAAALSDDFSDLSDNFADNLNDEPDAAAVDPLAAFDLEDGLGFAPVDQLTADAVLDPLAALAVEDDFQFGNDLSEPGLGDTSLDAASWSFDADPPSDSWLTEDAALEAPSPESLITELPTTDIPADASVPLAFTESFLEFNDLDELGQDAFGDDSADDLGTVELIESPDDDLPPELLVDDIATPGLYSSLHDTDAYSASYSDADADAEDEEVILDWMSEPIADPVFDSFPEDAEPTGDATWGQSTPIEPTLETEPTLEGFATSDPSDFYLDTDPPGSALEPDDEERTLDLTDGSYSSNQAVQFLPDPEAPFSAVDAAAPLELLTQTGETTDADVGQADAELLWADSQTEPNAMPAPGYFQSVEAPALDRPLLSEAVDPLPLSLEPTTDQNFDWDAEATEDATPEAAPRSGSGFNRLTSSILLFLAGWITLLIGYSLWTNLNAPSPPLGDPQQPQQLDLPPTDPPGAPVPPPVPPANQGTPPQPLPGEGVESPLPSP